MTVRIDTALPLSSPTGPPGPVGDAASSLSLAGQARAHPYLLEGERVAARGIERSGVADVCVDGARVVADLRSDAGLGVNVVVSPSVLRRECVGDRGTVIETVLALPTLPMAAVQWTGAGGLDVWFTVLPGQDGIRYHVRGRTLRAEAAEPETGVEILIHPEPESWQVVEGTEGGIQVHAQLPAHTPTSGPVTLLVAVGAPKGTARALDAGRHLGAHALRSATDQDPANVEALLPHTGVAEVDQGVGWATLRLAGALRREDPDGAGDWFWAGVGALASGDASGALRAAGQVGRDPSVSLRTDTPAPGPALSTWLTARAALLSGDEAPAQRALESLGKSTLDQVRSASDPAAWAWWTLALVTLADALRYGASDAEVQALRDAAALPAGRAPRRLPMVGTARVGGPEPGSPPWLRALLRGEGLAGTGEGVGPPGPAALAAWSALAAGDVEGGYATWRSTLRRGLAGEAGPRGSWDPPGVGAAAVLATLAFGLLGLEPDAPSGRIRVAPVLPTHLKDFRVRGIRVGDARLELAYARAGGVHRFHLSALDGRVPPMVILEPSLPFSTLGAVRVDGAPAELTSAPAGARTRLRIQIPVDGPRLLEIEEG